MKILFYLPEYPGIGGIVTVTETLASRFLASGHEIHILSNFSSKASSPLQGVTIWLMPDRHKYFTKANLSYATRIIKEQKYDAVIYQDSYAPTERIAVEATKSNGVRLIVAEHNSPLFVYNKRDLDPWYTKKGFLRRLLHPYLLRHEKRRKLLLFDNCDKYVLLADSFRNEFSRVTGIAPDNDKLVVINNPTRPSPNKSTEISGKENICLFVGRLVKEKQVDKLLLIWREIEKQLPDWRFLIVGDGPERKKLEKTVSAKRLKNVAFEGFCKPEEYYKKAKCLLLCSKMEGWGMILVEAMQYGCIPISLDSYSSLRDIIDDEINGFIIPKEARTEDWAAVIRNISGSSEKLQEMGHKAIEKAKEFEINPIAKKWETVLNP